MNPARLYVHTFAFLLIFGAALGHSLEMEHISLEQKQKLVDEFEHAKLEKADSLLNKKWSCDMYGVRSRMQVQRDVKLYSLSKGTDGIILNKGAQLVSDYKLENGALSGQKGKFEDSVRMKSDGQLISRLSLLKPEPVVIAYSVCKVL